MSNWISAAFDLEKFAVEPPRNREIKKVEDHSSHEEGEFSPKNDVQHNGHGTDAIFGKYDDQRPRSDGSKKSRFQHLPFLCAFFLVEDLGIFSLFRMLPNTF